jgi:hypothetical protein
MADGGHDISFGDSTCPGAHVDPKLGPLQDNGGPAATRAIAPDSPALDAVPASGAHCTATDERGVSRPQSAACDIGAFELVPAVPQAGGPAQGGGPQPVDTTAPVFSAASLSPKVFAVNRKARGEVAVSARKPKRGTTFHYTLSEAGRVVFTVERATPGRKVGGSCRKPTRSNRHKRRCTRYVRAGRFAQLSAAGANTRRFSGKIGRRALKSGSYRVTLVATDATGNASRAKRLSFKVVSGGA